MLPLITVRIPELVFPAEPPNVPNGAADRGGIGIKQADVAGATVKFQVKLLSIVLAGTAKSLTPVAPPSIVVVYVTPAVSALWGVNVAMRPVAGSRATDAAVTGVEAGAGPVTIKVVGVNVVGSILKPDGIGKVALMPALGHPVLALAAGLVESTDTFPTGLGAAAVKVHT